MSFMSSLKIINVVVRNPNIFLWIAPSVTDVAAVNPNGIKTLLASGFGIFPIKRNPVFSNGPKFFPKSHPYCPILGNQVFDNFISAEKLFEKALGSIGTCAFSLLESPTAFDESFRVTLVPFFIPYFNLLSCKLENFTFQVLGWVILFWYIKAK